MILDVKEKTIIQELIRNPRLSDNRLAKRTAIPLKTINRKRKKMEQAGIINYYVSVNNGPDGTEDFNATTLYLIRFRYGIFRKQFLDRMPGHPIQLKETQHIRYSCLGEKDGRLMLLMVIESRLATDILEIFNVEVMAKLRHALGHDAVEDASAIPLTSELVLLHNYAPGINMENGRIKDTWPNELIFVTDR